MWQQAGLLRSYFPESRILYRGKDELTWIGDLQPSALSGIYTIKVNYSHTKGLSVYVVKPKLVLAAECTELPHVYSTKQQQLCLFYPKDREWSNKMWIAKTIIPWASEWLYFYELWLATEGEWLGGGVEHENNITE